MGSRSAPGVLAWRSIGCASVGSAAPPVVAASWHLASSKRGLKNGLKDRVRTILLMLDETIFTETPPLYCSYGHIGQQTCVPITGSHAKRVLHGAINVGSGDVTLLITEQWTKETRQGHRIKRGGLGRMANPAFGKNQSFCGTYSHLFTIFMVALVIVDEYTSYVQYLVIIENPRKSDAVALGDTPRFPLDDPVSLEGLEYRPIRRSGLATHGPRTAAIGPRSSRSRSDSYPEQLRN